MTLARVVGNVVATRKDPRLEGKKLLVLQQVAPDGARERVICVAGSSARMASGMKDTPVDTAIVGIVDDINLLPEDR